MFHSEKRRLAAFAGDIEVIRQKLGASDAKALLDVGGGSGEVAAAVCGPGPRVVVVEPNARKRKRGAKRRPAFEFLDGQAEALPVPDGAFDRVISVVAFHHFHNQEAALREMLRVTAPGGRLLIFEMDPERAPGKLWTVVVGHTHFLDAAKLRSLVEAAGFADPQAWTSPSGYLVAAQRR